MPEILSQSQIDALLNSMNDPADEALAPETEQEPDQKYRKYDFYSPKKFTKEKLKMLNGIYENYARLASSQINSLFRAASEIEVIAVEEQRYYEFSNALSDNDVITVADVVVPDNVKNYQILLHTSALLMLNMIDRRLGSSGGVESVSASYTYTDVEIALYKDIMRYITGIMKDVWADYLDMDFNFARMEENPSMYQNIGMDETVVLIVLNVDMMDITGKITICMPGNFLQDAFKLIDQRKLISGGEPEDGAAIREGIMSTIKESVLHVTAELAKAQLRLNDIYSLRIGDVIDLNKPKNAEVSLYVEGQPWFKGQLGMHNRNVAVKISQRVEKEEKMVIE